MSEYELTPEETRLYLAAMQAKCDRLLVRQQRSGRREKLFACFSLTLFAVAGIVTLFASVYSFGFILLLAGINSIRAVITLSPSNNYPKGFNPDESEYVNRAIAATQDIEFVGLFADALCLNVGQDRILVIAALTRLLPQLTHEDAALFNTRQRRNLRVALYAGLKSKNYEGGNQFYADDFAAFCIATIQGLSEVGGEESITLVEKLANMKSESAQQARVRDAAHHYLPLIQQRAREEDASANLLRAADVMTPTTQLLRPATHSTNPTDAQQLLRATPNEEV